MDFSPYAIEGFLSEENVLWSRILEGVEFSTCRKWREVLW